MSTSGLTSEYNPPTLDGLTIIEADQLYVGGNEVDITTLVPYTGATQTLDMNSQSIKTSYVPTVPSDVINKSALDSAIATITGSVSASFLNKVLASPAQTVASDVSFSKSITITDGLFSSNSTIANLSDKFQVGTNYLTSLSGSDVVATGGFTSITAYSGYWETITTSGTTPGTATLFPITLGARYLFSIDVMASSSFYTCTVETSQSTNGTTPGTVLDTKTFAIGTSTYQSVNVSFIANVNGYAMVRVSQAGTLGTILFRFKALTQYVMGVALQNMSMPSQTADRVLVLNTNKQVVASGINSTKLGYLDNVSSDIQTQLNAKASTVYVDTQDGLRVLKSGDSVSGTLTFSSATPATFSAFVGSRVLITNATKNLVESSITSTVLGFLDATSSVQTQLNARALTTYVDSGLALKANLAGGNTFSGNQTYSDNSINTVAIFDGTKILKSSTVSTTSLSYLDATSSIQSQLNGKASTASLANYLPLAGGTMTGTINMGGNFVNCDSDPVGLTNLARKSYVDTLILGRVSKAGDTMTGTLTVNSTVNASVNSNIVPGFKLINSSNHYDSTASEALLFNGPNGEIMIARNTTRDATTANLLLGSTSLEVSEVVSTKSNGTGFMPLNFGGSSFFFTGGFLGVGSGISGLNKGANCKLTVNSSYSAGDTDGFCINASDSATVPNAYNLRIYPYVQSGGNVGYQFRTYNGATAYDSFKILSTGALSLDKSITANSGVIWDAMGTCKIYNGAQDNYSPGTLNNNLIIKSWWGIAFTAYDDVARIGMDCRTGSAYFGGNVGIAQTAPRNTLDVVGNITTDWNDRRIGIQYTDGSSYFMGMSAGSASRILYLISKSGDNTGGVQIQTGSTPSTRLNITADGSSYYTAGDNSYIRYGPNATWSSYLHVGATTNKVGQSATAQVITTNGNVHIDSGYVRDIYLNYYSNTAGQAGQTRLYGTMYYDSPPTQSRGSSATYGGMLTYDVVDKLVKFTTIEAYHSGSLTTQLIGNWNNVNRTYQFYKHNQSQGLIITGYATAFRSSAGFQEIWVRLYSQSTGLLYYYQCQTFYNATYNHQPVPINIEAGGIPGGWYDVYTYFSNGGQATDGNDTLTLSYILLATSLTSS